jgi:hypothetical protein
MKMPATTMVAAWISADTGVGPAMASGSHTCRMNWPLFDITAAVRHRLATSKRWWLMSPALANSLVLRMSNEPAAQNRTVMPTSSPTSPTRFVMNALSAASLFGFSSHQWPINTKEHKPTSSHDVMNSSVLRLITSMSIEAVNSDRNAK